MRSKQKMSKSSVSGCLFWEYSYASLSVCLQCCQVFQASKYRKVLNKDVNNRWHFSINPKLLPSGHTHSAKSHHLVLQIFIVYFLQGFQHTSNISYFKTFGNIFLAFILGAFRAFQIQQTCNKAQDATL